MTTQPRASDLIRDAFAVPEEGIWVERGGVTVRGQRPDWLDWPCVRGDQIGREREPHVELVKQSKAARR